MPRGLAVLLLALFAIAPAQGASPPTDTATLTGQHIVGYQGWFVCPGDRPPAQGSPHDSWAHWFHTSRDAPPRVVVDMLPDTSELTPAERCPSGWRDRAGREISLYSNRNATTVDRHFAWMAEYGIHTAAAQRFVIGLTVPAVQARFDTVLDNIRRGAEAHHRGFFVAYDISGLRDDQLPMLAADWRALRGRGLTDSPAYQRHRGRPVLMIWGLGFRDRPGDPAAARALLAAVRDAGPVTLVGGVPTNWRTLDRDAKGDAEWAAIYRSFEVLSPWTVGRYGDARSIDANRIDRLLPDLEATRRTGQDLMPVIFPGFSWANVMALNGRTAPRNAFPRRCGAFYWDQARALGRSGATMVYTAMFDEVNEGTAIYKLAPTARDLPESPVFVPLDIDGCRLPSDWYLRIAGQISRRIGTRDWPDRLPLALP
ncbi:glycoside hydrolase family 71/99-like protein [Humitalea sp. 24SJ18S-53]|uniref:glycoside hydrolase family 71/99-like protein n=1 Tax=Humitalea sp. 24SJ18S-53 TaxID=3422307 RepID=UPI003D6696EF